MKRGGNHKILFHILFALFFSAALLFTADAASAGAVIFFSPSAPKVNEGDVFEVSVYVKSTDQAMNACEAVITFPTSKLEILSVSSKSSIFNLMVQNPTFSNNAGTINFSGVVLNPGYTGSAGRLLTLSFRAKAAGTAKLNFSSAQVLANDGIGTDILSVASSALVTIGQKKAEVLPEVAPTPPPAPVTVPGPETQPVGLPATTTVTTTTALPLSTTTVEEIAATSAPAAATTAPEACNYDQLPMFFIKIGGLHFGFLWIVVLLLIICILASLYALIKAENLSGQLRKHHQTHHKLK